MDLAMFLDRFGRAVRAGNATVFVGAGVSASAAPRLGDWSDLVAPLREKAKIPSAVQDLPLVAEYYEQVYDRSELDDHVAGSIASASADAEPSDLHLAIRELPVSEVWTTNYDRLLEATLPESSVVVDEDGIANRVLPGHSRVIKMHGSLKPNGQWESDLVITRGDYESYEQSHPRLWAALTATFLTRSILFLGFGFRDPNIDFFLRLIRRHGQGAYEHFAVLRRPTKSAERRLHEHRVRDLEASGIGVVEIKDYDEQVPLLDRLIRRCLPPRLFVGGSGEGIGPACHGLGRRLAKYDELEVVSLAGPAGRAVSYGFADRLRESGRYEAERIRFMFRDKADPPGERPPAPDQRTGMSVYTDLPVEELRRHAVDGVRAVLVVGGGSRTGLEIEVARDLGVPVVPLGAFGGAARRAWRRQASRSSIRLSPVGDVVPPQLHARLGEVDARKHGPAVVRLLREAMYLEDAQMSHA